MKKIFCAAALAAVAFLPLACMKETELVADFGPEVTTEGFRKLVKPEPPTFESVRANEFGYAVRETFVDGRPFAINYRWGFTVTSRTELSDRYIVGLNHELREYSGGQEKTSTKKGEIAVGKSVPPPTPASVTASHYPTRESARRALADTSPQHPKAKSSLVSFSPLSLFARNSLQALEAPIRRTMHNLSFTKGTFPIPEFVKQRANCGGLSASVCSSGVLKAFHLTYDEVEWTATGGQKYSISRVYSSEIPFFASIDSPLVLTSDIDYFYPGVIQACIKTDMPYNGVTIQITQCDEIKDFTFGTP